MKDSTSSAHPAVGYLAAFTLGIICMSVIMFFARGAGDRHAHPQPSNETSHLTAPSKKIHFDRSNQTELAPVNPPLPRAIVRQPTIARAVGEEPPPFEVTPKVEPAPMAETSEVVPQPVFLGVNRPVLGSETPDGARIAGRALLMFRPHPEKVLPLDPRCATKHRGPVHTRHFVVGRENGLADVLIMVTAGLPNKQWPVPERPVTLRLRGCIYENHIVGVQTGQKLLVSNLDNISHNVHVMPEQNPESNRASLPRSRPLEYIFHEPELFLRFKCDVHPWEFAYANVIDHPYFAISDANGNFAIQGLPPGRYTVEAHHRKAGALRKEVVVDQSRNISLNFQFHEAQVQAQNI